MTLFAPDGQVLLDITIPWTPQVKERPRTTKGSTSFYTPERTRKAEAAIKKAFEEAAGDWSPYEQPCSVEWTFANEFIGIRLSEWIDYEHRKLRGDLDNYQKIVSDALNGTLYDDDKRIVRTAAVKL